MMASCMKSNSFSCCTASAVAGTFMHICEILDTAIAAVSIILAGLISRLVLLLQ